MILTAAHPLILVFVSYAIFGRSFKFFDRIQQIKQGTYRRYTTHSALSLPYNLETPSNVSKTFGSACPFCDDSFSSGNRMYDHIRNSPSCYKLGVDKGMDLSRGVKKSQVALLLSYTSPQEFDMQNILQNVLGEYTVGKFSFTRATGWGYRLSSLLSQEENINASGDVIIYSEKKDLVTDSNKWLDEVNSKLPKNIQILARDGIVNASLHAEQDCTVRVYEYILPNDIFFTKSNYNNISFKSLSTSNQTSNSDDISFFTSLKLVLRSLSSPKLARLGGYKFRKSKVQKDIKEDYRWHNFCGESHLRVVPTDSAVCRILDRFVVSDPIINGKTYFKFRLSGDGFLRQQVRRIIGTTICIMRGFLPSSFASFALDPSIIIETPLAPPFLYLKECRYDWYHHNALFENSKDKLYEKANEICENIINSENYHETLDEWIHEMETVVCPRIRKSMEDIIQSKEIVHVSPSSSLSSDLHMSIGNHYSGDHISSDNNNNHNSDSGVDNVDSDAPPVYRKVLRLLREADKSGKWPDTSISRSRVMRVLDPALGGSFSAGRPAAGSATPRGNEIFAELVEAVFKLEQELVPGRPASSMVAINRRATFLPHTDAGAGFGQSTSLIVGLGRYVGGDLCVEGSAHDIQYSPLSFDGWRQRHWTLPFEGERFSLVWFTPIDQSPGALPSDRYNMK